MQRITAVLGTQWGDEGKGGFVDFLGHNGEYTLTARFNGGNNAGHTAVIDGKRHAFHLLPASSLVEGMTVLLGKSMVIDIDVLLGELDWVSRANPSLTVHIDPRAHAIMRSHIERDGLYEEDREIQIGSTRRGVGPAQADRVLRRGIPIIAAANALAPHLDSLFAYSEDVLDQHENVLLAGAHGAMLDLWNGDYPYVTSTSCNIDSVGPGLGLNPRQVQSVIGVVKAYGTRVGNGPLPYEMPPEVAGLVRETASEYGTTTGRPRRIAWLDLDSLKRAHRVNDYTAFALTHLDVFDDWAEIHVALDGGLITLPWRTSMSVMQYQSILPSPVRDLLRLIRERLSCPVRFVSTGPDRDQWMRSTGYDSDPWMRLGV